MKSYAARTRNFPLIVQIEWDKIFAGLELKKFLAYVIFVTCFLMGALLYLWPHMQLLQNGFQYNGLQVHKERLLDENRALRLEFSSLNSLDRVERMARNELGMTTPKEGQIVYVALESTGKNER